MLLGQLQLKTPLFIGSGTADTTCDLPVLKDGQGCPYIPGTSLAGALKNHFAQHICLTEQQHLEQSHYFWGKETPPEHPEGEHTWQSALLVQDALLLPHEKATITRRDGIKINPMTGIVQDKFKYDFEIIEPGALFQLHLEVTLRQAFCRRFFRAVLAWLADQLAQGAILLGGMSRVGFGQCWLINGRLYEYDFQRREHVIDWLSNRTAPDEGMLIWAQGEKTATQTLGEKIVLLESRPGPAVFQLKAQMRLKTSLLFGHYPDSSLRNDQPILDIAPDKVPVKCAGQNILPGTALRGALRNRAERIVRTLGGNPSILLDELFGRVEKKAAPSGKPHKEFTNPTKQKGKLRVGESILDSRYFINEIQMRISIDRFTGGALAGRLFDSMPLWPLDQSGNALLELQMEIVEYAPWQIGLILLLLKDLWTGDLPLGGEKAIGRGVLTGHSACLTFHNSQAQRTIKIIEQDNSLLLSASDTQCQDRISQELNDYIKSFLEMCRQNPLPPDRAEGGEE
ncbi:MAG: RAMP superfamily CRISPR-associated protein [Desulfurispora sp.]|uniref:RAMP superfamily CRISPR-associated protein n=1 Tax=Desulfurispora sp. TaxID=3014275 RepID=UPI00404AC4C0